MNGTQISKCEEPLLESKSSSALLQEIVKNQHVEELDSKDNKSITKTNHKRIHQLEGKCDQCQKRFSENFLLKRHVLSVHKKIKNFSCETCRKAFFAKSDLKAHTLSVHQKIKDFHCTSCDQVVNDRYSQKWYRPIPNIRPDTAEYLAEYSADN